MGPPFLRSYGSYTWVSFLAILAGGVKESATVNKIFTALNLGILSYVCIIGAFKDDPGNWFISESEAAQHTDCGHTDNTTGCGTGGFMPYGRCWVNGSHVGPQCWVHPRTLGPWLCV